MVNLLSVLYLSEHQLNFRKQKMQTFIKLYTIMDYSVHNHGLQYHIYLFSTCDVGDFTTAKKNKNSLWPRYSTFSRGIVILQFFFHGGSVPPPPTPSQLLIEIFPYTKAIQHVASPNYALLLAACGLDQDVIKVNLNKINLPTS